MVSQSVTGELDQREPEPVGPATLTEVLAEFDGQVAGKQTTRLRPLATGFSPLDDILNGGIRPTELLMIGGAFGVGKTIWSLQVARNVVASDPSAAAMYICYEHDRVHMLMRLLCMESAEMGLGDEALTLRRIAQLALVEGGSGGLLARLRQRPRYAAVLDALARYQDRLVLIKASGDHTTLADITEWIDQSRPAGIGRLLVVVDYLQKIRVARSVLEELDATTYLAQGLKELAMSREIAVISIAASDRPGLQSKRMVLSDLRGSSALQYEADIGLILNNKFEIVSREHMVYNLAQADSMRNWVVMTVEKNRAGRHAVDMQYMQDASHFRMLAQGDFVRDRLVDNKLILA
jgi:replicative DNA helicase